MWCRPHQEHGQFITALRVENGIGFCEPCYKERMGGPAVQFAEPPKKELEVQFTDTPKPYVSDVPKAYVSTHMVPEVEVEPPIQKEEKEREVVGVNNKKLQVNWAIIQKRRDAGEHPINLGKELGCSAATVYLHTKSRPMEGRTGSPYKKQFTAKVQPKAALRVQVSGGNIDEAKQAYIDAIKVEITRLQQLLETIEGV